MYRYEGLKMVRERTEMAGLTFQCHSVVVIVMALTLAAFGAAADSPPANSKAATSPNCERKCGDVEIPYPFGIGAGCFSEGLDVVCNRSLRPPRPFIGDTSIELIDVSPSLGRARAHTQVSWLCNNATSVTDVKSISFNLSTRPAFTISANENKFTAVGWATIGLVSNGDYITGCISVCSEAGVINGTCDGFGCCQTAIRDGMTAFEIGTGYVNNTLVGDSDRCGYAFIVENERYNFSSADLGANTLNKTYKSGVPVVLDWSVGNMTICDEARRNLTSPPLSYACIAKNSECIPSSNGERYKCNCTIGYQGNPYVPDGCTDIDECSLRSEYKCHGICKNRRGNYTCSCPPGETGDPTIEDGCHSTSSTLPQYLKVLIDTGKGKLGG